MLLAHCFYSNIVFILIHDCCRLLHDQECFSSVHRLLYYTKSTKPEAALTVPGQPPPDWPKSGSIIFSKISARYTVEGPRILKSLDLEIKAGETVGIVGRSGCGKSTLGLLLFRLLEPRGGTIIIDGVDYRELGLKDLRQAMSYVGQNPVMFSGTLRKNLDPENKYEDSSIWKALDACYCSAFASSAGGLSSDVENAGSNFSIGVCQLFCLARTMLKCNKIVFLDEITGFIDTKTENLIIETLEKEFKSCTILCIAHRLATIRNFDRFVKIEGGKAIEMPKDLFTREELQNKGIDDLHEILLESGKPSILQDGDMDSEDKATPQSGTPPEREEFPSRVRFG